jgi:muramoyltetrapeptide carboxypeptidase
MLCAVPLVFPPPLAPGDLVVVVAPSSPVPTSLLWPGLAWLRTRYRIRMSAGALSRDGFLAGSDRRRRDELARALTDSEVRAIVAVRGGYGAMRMVNDLPWGELVRRPRWIVGFSDVTALHAMAWRAGVASVHGPNVSGLGGEATPAVRAAWIGSIEGTSAGRAWKGLKVLRSGEAHGVVVGGNLALVHAMAAAGCLAVPEGAVLVLEDVSEAPYRVDRMLTSLYLGGHLARASAIVFGGFDRCGPGPDGRQVEDVLEERTHALGIPVLAEAPFGHQAHNEAFVLGSEATVTGAEVRFRTR